MRECLNCKKEYQHKREASKFCSGKCRVKYNRDHPQDKVTKVQMQVLYNAMMEKLDGLDKIVAVAPKKVYDSPHLKITYDEPPQFQRPQIALKSFEQWKAAKHECESEEEWVKIKEGIIAAPNLSSKQKDLLIKYS